MSEEDSLIRELRETYGDEIKGVTLMGKYSGKEVFIPDLERPLIVGPLVFVKEDSGFRRVTDTDELAEIYALFFPNN